MFSGDGDIIKATVLTNAMIEANHRSVLMNMTKFLPYLEIQTLRDIENGVYSIFKTNEVNYTELLTFIEPMIHIQERSNDQSKYLVIPFRKCKLEDFTLRDFEPDQKMAEKIGTYICPDAPSDFDYYRVENKYTNYTYRVSFSVDIHICIPGGRIECKSNESVKRFLEDYYFTFYTLQERVDFSLARPIKTISTFNSQF